MSARQYGRKATLLVSRPQVAGNNPSAFVPGSTLDLSEFRFTFKTVQQDVESPNNCAIRVYNLSRQTIETISKSEYSRVILQAGYGDAFGVIFDGTLKQYRTGRESATTTYLDLLVADGDVAYNYAIINKTLAGGSSAADRVDAAVDAMGPYGVTKGYISLAPTGGVLPRGKVLFGMPRVLLRQEATAAGATWNISNGQVNITPLDGYLPGDAVELNAATGMIGIPEQTNDGVKVRCLLNPRIVVGGRVQINNKAINQTAQQNPNAAPTPYNLRAGGPQRLATITSDGFYRVYVAEHTGDTRGRDWYTDIVCLAVDPSTKKVVAQ